MLYLVLENGEYTEKHHGLTLIEYLVLCKRKLGYPIWTQVRVFHVFKIHTVIIRKVTCHAIKFLKFLNALFKYGIYYS